MDLLAGPLDATAIAHAAGFADSSHLWRTCTRAFGLQPSRAADRKTVQVRPLQFS
jgi:AraC-like DNA-binding protein